MRRLFLVLLLLLAAPLAAEESATTMNVSVWADVDAAGRVTGLEFRDGLHPSIEKLVRRFVEPIAFEPATAGGKPVSSRSSLMCYLKLTPNGAGGYVVEVSSVDQAGSLPLTSVWPSYPPEALSGGIGGMVVVDLWIDARGRVDTGKTKVSASSFHRGGEPYDGVYTRKLVKAALDAAAKWTFEQPHVDGAPVPTRRFLPIKFTPPDGMPFEYGGLKADPPVARSADPSRSLGHMIQPRPAGGD